MTDKPKWKRADWLRVIAAFILGAVVLFVVLDAIFDSNDAVKQSRAEATTAEAAATSAANQAVEGQNLAQQVAAACAETDPAKALPPEVAEDLCASAESVASQEPPPVDGKNGKDGKNGIDGKDGTDGLPGTNGTDGKSGVDGTDGTDGDDGADGVSVTSMTCQADGNWLIAYSDGTEQVAPGPCVGQPGANGSNGTALPGTYQCPAGEYLTGVTVNPDGTITPLCALLPAAPTTEAPAS